jgi:hypothetical protein
MHSLIQQELVKPIRTPQNPFGTGPRRHGFLAQLLGR